MIDGDSSITKTSYQIKLVMIDVLCSALKLNKICQISIYEN